MNASPPSRAETLRRRRCFGLRTAVVFGVILAVTVHGDWMALAVVAAGTLLALVALLVDCRRSPGSGATK